MTILIHIGSPRTGTTSIQHFLDISKVDLDKRGLLIPSLGWSRGGHAEFRRTLLQLPTRIQSLTGFLKKKKDNNEQLLKIRDDFTSLLLRPTHQHLLISTESFWTINPERLLKIYPQLTQHHCYILCCLRDPVDFASSHYAQKVKAGRLTMPIRTWLKSNISLYDYDNTISPWEGSFGKENVICYSYEKAAKEGIISTFLDWLQSLNLLSKDKLAEIVNLHSPLIQSKHANPSPSDAILELLLSLNRTKMESSIKDRIRQKILKDHSKHPIESSISFSRNIDSELSKVLRDKNKRFLQSRLK
jgi:hypothetical protein